MNNPIIIVGAGPVGLTLALLLHRQGKTVQIYESVPELKPLGVGINLLPHSVRVLYNLDLGTKLDQIAIRTAALHYYNKFGQAIWAEARGLDAGYSYPQYSVHRGELQLMLLKQVLSELGEEVVQTSMKLMSWDDTEEGVNAYFLNAQNTRVTVKGSCLIAADGINSTARRCLFPNEGRPIYGGRILWRGVTKGSQFLDGRTMFMAGHQDCKFVAYSIGDIAEGSLINWIAELSVPDLSSFRKEQDQQDWNKEVAIDVFKAPFQSWKFPWVDIPAIIEHCEHVYEFPLADRDPLPQWTHGNMTLVGDAAHPMYPIGSNGASQGILDAEKLASELAKPQSITAAFQAYENERRPATAKIVLLNRQNGPEQVMQMAEERSPSGFDNIEAVISQQELEEIAARYKQTAGFTVQAVNEKANNEKANNNATS
jgi:2-polyprenyl-6-methoxyphenol hydroxylase-like FAD-dependent oxidoreductase